MANWVDTYLEQNPEQARLPVATRSRFSLHLNRGRGRRLALITGVPMHYYSSAQRDWLPLDTSLKPLGDGRYGAPGLPFVLGPDGSVAMEGSTYRHRTWRVGVFAVGRFVQMQRLGEAKLHGDRLVRETFNLQLETILLPGGLREELTLFEAPIMDAAKAEFFALESLLPSGMQIGGPTSQPERGQARWLPGWAQDAEGNRIPLLNWTSEDGTRLYSGVPASWLTNAAYPVVIDPDIDVTGETADGYIEGTSTTTSATFDSSGANINVGGRNVSGSPKVWRGYVKFNTSSLSSTASVERVNLQMYPNLINNNVAWTIYVRQYNWSANDPMVAGTREAAWDGLLAAANSGILATSTNPAGTPVTSQDLPTSWVETEGNTYYGLWCNQEGYGYPSNQGGQHQYSSANHTTPSQRPLLMVEYVGSYPLSGPIPLRSSLLTPRVTLPDTRLILRSRERRTALNAKINVN
jgi:hypothetical protein